VPSYALSTRHTSLVSSATLVQRGQHGLLESLVFVVLLYRGLDVVGLAYLETLAGGLAEPYEHIASLVDETV